MKVCPRGPSPERYFMLGVENWVVFEFFLSLNRSVTPCFTSLFKNLSYFYSAGISRGAQFPGSAPADYISVRFEDRVLILSIFINTQKLRKGTDLGNMS